MTASTAAATNLGSTTTDEDIIDTLSFFEDWEERYGYIIELGKELPPYPEALHTEEHIVRGCQSQVWLHIEMDEASGKMLLFLDSDAIIVRGLAAIVSAALNQKTPQEIVDYDMQSYFAKIDLLKHLSPTRGNGIQAMVERIKNEAKARI